MSESTDTPSPVVTVSSLGKKFAKSLGQTLRYGLVDIGREFLFQGEAAPSLRPGEFWALDDVSFELKRGEALAIIGRNGSGKSTLLKLLYGLIKPDAGGISIRGRMAALIELGAGFDPILSGHENVYINASILGLSREEVDDLMPSIIEFSGLRDFIETPVKFYSSGMRARLAFSIATNLSPDIFLVDEVLAVGDMEFRQKCLRNMVAFVENGGSLIFVSHTANQIQMLCNRGVVIDSGKLVCEGSALEALDHYYSKGLHREVNSKLKAEPSENPDCSITSVEIQPNPETGAIRTGGEFSVSITAKFQREAHVIASVTILARDLLTVVAIESSEEPRRCGPGIHVFRFCISNLPLMPGIFHLRGALRESPNLLPLAHFGIMESPISFLVGGEATREKARALASGQLVRLGGRWS
jgi:lipopolysaccharide transport system ATP-binding protein